MMTNKQMGIRLKELRKSFELTLGEVSRHTNIDESTLSKIEHGKRRITVEILCKIAPCYGGINNVVRHVLLQEKSLTP